jgi:hypothetical protein
MRQSSRTNKIILARWGKLAIGVVASPKKEPQTFNRHLRIMGECIAKIICQESNIHASFRQMLFASLHVLLQQHGQLSIIGNEFHPIAIHLNSDSVVSCSSRFRVFETQAASHMRNKEQKRTDGWVTKCHPHLTTTNVVVSEYP